ncbi:MAG: efflux RND transporter periplasmic adaptor subunit [Acidobacteriota bacterium]|nr:MAG: efflux RND transporter periplasmic adaptor subunit [Acidobacteriota bacterium]
MIGIALWFWLRPEQVTTAEVVMRQISPAIQGVGTVEAKVVIQLASKITGRIIAIHVDQGDTIKVGQTLIELESSEAVAEVERARAGLERSKLAVPAQQAALLRAQADLSAANAAVTSARARQTLAHANAERWRRLSATGDVPLVEFEDRVTEAKVADEDLRSAEARQQAAMKEIAAQEALLRMTRNEPLVAAASLATALARKEDTIITSPIDGYVVSRELETGSAVNPGTPILKLADPHTAWVTVFVDEREAGPIAVGDKAEIALRSLPGVRLGGRIARIQRESDRVTEQLAVDVAFDNPPPRLTLGEQAEAKIYPSSKIAAALPLGAVVRTAQGAGAWTVVDGTLRFKRARFGVIDPSGWIEVLEGLSAGERVVLAPGRLADLKNEGLRVSASAQIPVALRSETQKQ